MTLALFFNIIFQFRRTKPSTESFAIYRKFQLVNSRFNDCLCKEMIPVYIGFMSLVITVSAFIIIKTHDTTPPILYGAIVYGFITNSLFTSMLFQMSASIHTRSSLIIESWIGENDISKVNERTLKSLKPLGIKNWDRFTYERETPVSFFCIVFDMTINMLLGAEEWLQGSS